MAPDGFTPISAVVQGAGGSAENMTVSVAGLPNSALKGAGKVFVKAFTKADGRAPDPYSVYAAQATEALVAAIKQSNGSRADVTKQLFKIKLPSSILGAVSFNSNGDVTVEPGHDLQGEERQVGDLQGHRPAELTGQVRLSRDPRPHERTREGASPPSCLFVGRWVT